MIFSIPQTFVTIVSFSFLIQKLRIENQSQYADNSHEYKDNHQWSESHLSFDSIVKSSREARFHRPRGHGTAEPSFLPDSLDSFPRCYIIEILIYNMVVLGKAQSLCRSGETVCAPGLRHFLDKLYIVGTSFA